MAKKVGKDAKVVLGSANVVAMGAWSLDGVSTEQIDASAFGDDWKQFEFGMKDGGTLSFDGFFDPADVTGQGKLTEANLYNSKLTNLKLYIDKTSYFEPCQTTGYFSPALTTGAPTAASNVVITSAKISQDKSGLAKVNFTGKISGVMVLV